MDFSELFRRLPELFELSPLDKIVAFLVVVLTFSSHIFDLAQVAGKKHLDFVRWLVKYKEDLHKLRNREKQLKGADSKKTPDVNPNVPNSSKNDDIKAA